MTDLADLVKFGQIDYLKISVNNNMNTHTSLTVSSIIMPSWVGASKSKQASVIFQSTKKKKILTSGMLGESFHYVVQNKNTAR